MNAKFRQSARDAISAATLSNSIPVRGILDMQEPTQSWSATYEIAPSTKKTRLEFELQVDSSALVKQQSDAYLGAIRRKECQRIQGLIRDLASHVERDDFYMAIHAPLQATRELIKRLMPSRVEANAREMLRQLRDSLIGEQGDKYKETKVRETVVREFDTLCKSTSILMNDVLNFTDELEGVGFCALGVGDRDDWSFLVDENKVCD